jgi:hypothetical protein
MLVFTRGEAVVSGDGRTRRRGGGVGRLAAAKETAGAMLLISDAEAAWGNMLCSPMLDSGFCSALQWSGQWRTCPTCS